MLPLLVLLFPLTASASMNSSWHTTPLKMDIFTVLRRLSVASLLPQFSFTGRHNTIWNKHYIVYSCNFSSLHSVQDATRDLKPFACDPSNGIDTRLRRRPLWVGREQEADDGFVYECTKDTKTGAVTYKAKSCFVDNERFQPGHFIKGAHGSVWLCYRGLDNVIRLRIRHPAHTVCNPAVDDPRCFQGIAQTVITSVYGYGEAFAYNPSTGESLTVAIAPPEHFRMINLADNATNVSPTDLLLAVQGVLDPRVKRVTAHPRAPIRGIWGGITTTPQPTTPSSSAPPPSEEFKKAK